MKRRNFTKITAFGSLIGLVPTEIFSKSINSKKDIKISLAQWSLNKAIKSGKLSPLDFAKKAKSFGINAIEYVSGLYTNHTDTLEKMSMKVDWEVIEGTNDEDLINTISMCCPFDVNEKQALLEAISLEDRREVLTSLIHMNLNKNNMGSRYVS